MPTDNSNLDFASVKIQDYRRRNVRFMRFDKPEPQEWQHVVILQGTIGAAAVWCNTRISLSIRMIDQGKEVGEYSGVLRRLQGIYVRIAPEFRGRIAIIEVDSCMY